MAIRSVGVVGCGLMGSGIAQTCTQSGYETVVREVNQQLLDKGIARIYDASKLPPTSLVSGKKLRPYLLFELCLRRHHSWLRTMGNTFFHY
jgi:3-hydroxyacyl-CoA dehydrogenase